MRKNYLHIKKDEVFLLGFLRKYINHELIFAFFYALYTSKLDKCSPGGTFVTTFEVTNYAISELYNFLGKESFISNETKEGFCLINHNNADYKNISRIFSTHITRSPYITRVRIYEGVPYYKILIVDNEMQNHFNLYLPHALNIKENLLKKLFQNKQQIFDKYVLSHVTPVYTLKQNLETNSIFKKQRTILPKPIDDSFFLAHLQFHAFAEQYLDGQVIPAEAGYIHNNKRKSVIPLDGCSENFGVDICNKHNALLESKVDPMSLKFILNS